MSNYPPGVIGNEYAITGPEKEWEMPICDTCSNCGFEAESETVLMQFHRKLGTWWFCPECDSTNTI